MMILMKTIIIIIIMIMNRYSTCTPKLTQNRFVEGEEKPELLDDWDQRLVVSMMMIIMMMMRMMMMIARSVMMMCR